jgi:hypothetical protein
MPDLVYIGMDRAGLDEARRDVERHAAKIAASIRATKRPDLESAVVEAMTCPQEWPTK